MSMDEIKVTENSKYKSLEVADQQPPPIRSSGLRDSGILLDRRMVANGSSKKLPKAKNTYKNTQQNRTPLKPDAYANANLKSSSN